MHWPFLERTPNVFKLTQTGIVAISLATICSVGNAETFLQLAQSGSVGMRSEAPPSPPTAYLSSLPADPNRPSSLHTTSIPPGRGSYTVGGYYYVCTTPRGWCEGTSHYPVASGKICNCNGQVGGVVH